MKMSRQFAGVLAALAMAAVCGVYPPAARAVYADGGNAVFVIIVTLCMRTAGMVVFCMLNGRRLFDQRGTALSAFSGGFFQALSVASIFASLAYIPGPVMVIILYTHSLILLFFMAWRGEMKITPLVLAATVTALCGLTFVVDVWHPQQLSIPGIAFALVSALATMSRIYVYGRLTRSRDPIVVGAEAFLFATGFVLLLPLASAPHLPATAMGYVWTAAACGSLMAGTFAMFYAIALLGSFQFSLFGKLEPVFTAIFSAVLIGEYLTWPQYAGMAAVLSALAVYQYGTARPQPQPVQAPVSAPSPSR